MTEQEKKELKDKWSHLTLPYLLDELMSISMEAQRRDLLSVYDKAKFLRNTIAEWGKQGVFRGKQGVFR